MRRKNKAKKKIDFFLDNTHYLRLNITLYLISVLAIVLIYFVTLMIFSKFVNMIITAVFSFTVGLYIVYNRSFIVRKISNYIENQKIKKYKEKSKRNLKHTIHKITPSKKNNLELKIKNKISLKEKIKNINLFSKKHKKKNQNYIEIK
ncbi:MAG: hypothetical protein ACOC16_00110 [Nanoarchaeota archaeon]